ncbi:MAG: ATP-binding protein [Fodinibius sp.]|nr:ATP-binding protein [Fodinibius sp.]
MRNILDAFQKLVKKTRDIYDVECNLNQKLRSKKSEGCPSASSLYYVCQEAIQNAIHHGQADKIEVMLSADKTFLVLTIKDNGVGYEESKEAEGMGINIMRHRAELLGGTLQIKKAPHGNGTIVTCQIPFEEG